MVAIDEEKVLYISIFIPLALCRKNMKDLN